MQQLKDFMNLSFVHTPDIPRKNYNIEIKVLSVVEVICDISVKKKLRIFCPKSFDFN